MNKTVETMRNHYFYECHSQSYSAKKGQLELNPVELASIKSHIKRRNGVLHSTIRRSIDILASIALLGASFTFLLIIAALIKIDSKGPVFYRQKRAGLNGVEFDLLKFRTMKNDAERYGPKWASENDNRITKLGKFLRKTRIDELPQLLNVLTGSMTLIGPRPERQFFIDQIVKTVSGFELRTLVKPGITGWAQVCHPYTATIEEAKPKLQYDLYYIKHRSILFDVKILMLTVYVVVFKIGSR